jgi:hypothetical protein
MRPILVFGAACWCTFLLICAFAVFVLDQYEHAWGLWSSLTVEAWVSLVGALVAMGAFGIASAFMRHTHSQRTAAALGVGCSITFVASCWVINSIEFAGSVYAALVLLVAVSCLAAYLGEVLDS